jgi:hypothetical protein
MGNDGPPGFWVTSQKIPTFTFVFFFIRGKGDLDNDKRSPITNQHVIPNSLFASAAGQRGNSQKSPRANMSEERPGKTYRFFL